MSASATSVEPDVIQDWASRYADVALTANLAATALRRMSENPEADIPARYSRALKEMAATLDTMVKLENRDRLTALVDQTLGVVENFEPAQMIARLASDQADESATKEKLRRLLKFRDGLQGLLDKPEPNVAGALFPVFKRLSHDAMRNAQRGEEAISDDEFFSRSRLAAT